MIEDIPIFNIILAIVIFYSLICHILVKPINFLVKTLIDDKYEHQPFIPQITNIILLSFPLSFSSASFYSYQFVPITMSLFSFVIPLQTFSNILPSKTLKTLNSPLTQKMLYND